MYWQCCLVVAWLVPRETAAISAQILCAPCNYAPIYSVTSSKATCECSESAREQRTVLYKSDHQCLAVTCHMHFWQNDRDLLCATAVTRGQNRYPNKSQHRKLTLNKKIPPPLLPGLEPAILQSRVPRSTTKPSPLPGVYQMIDCWSAFAKSCLMNWNYILFRYPFHPGVTAVALKRSNSFCQKCRWQVTAKHACTCIIMRLCMKWMAHSCMVYTERAETAVVSYGTSHANAVSTPLRWILKKKKKAMKSYKKLVTHTEPHASAVSLLERSENSAM